MLKRGCPAPDDVLPWAFLKSFVAHSHRIKFWHSCRKFYLQSDEKVYENVRSFSGEATCGYFGPQLHLVTPYTYTHTHTHTRAHIHTHTHTHTHTHIYGTHTHTVPGGRQRRLHPLHSHEGASCRGGRDTVPPSAAAERNYGSRGQLLVS